MKQVCWINGSRTTMTKALDAWRNHYLLQGGDVDFADEIFALATYDEEAEDAEMSPEHARDLLLDAGIEITH